MSFRPNGPGPGFVVARLLLASVFIVMGAWRLWAAYNGATASGATLSFSAAELVLGVLVAAGWKLRWTALLSAALLVADAVLSHPFWTLAEPARSAQLLHFMKNAAIVGGFLLLSLAAPARRR
jgi:putative oxidoreductase